LFCLIKDISQIFFPAFKANSFMQLLADSSEASVSTIHSAASTAAIDISDEFSVEIEFKPTSISGVIAYVLSEHSSSDFLCILLRDSLIEMRIYSRGGNRDIRSDDLGIYSLSSPIQRGKYHRLFVKKRKKHLLMQLDDQIPFQGRK
jgi:hypothetical protein